jgi:phosphoribosylaminoimidazole-succinocarboxamide synthase
LVNDDHLRLMNVATPAVLRELRELAHRVNRVLNPFFAERKMQLVDFKLEFGIYHNKLILADEISPDTCRLWDMATGESMDKDRFRKDMGKIEEAYQEVLKRVCG